MTAENCYHTEEEKEERWCVVPAGTGTRSVRERERHDCVYNVDWLVEETHMCLFFVWC